MSMKNIYSARPLNLESFGFVWNLYTWRNPLVSLGFYIFKDEEFISFMAQDKWNQNSHLF